VNGLAAAAGLELAEFAAHGVPVDEGIPHACLLFVIVRQRRDIFGIECREKARFPGSKIRTWGTRQLM